jgi:hypothetical protein
LTRYPVTATLSVAVKLLIETARVVEVAGIVNALTVGAVPSAGASTLMLPEVPVDGSEFPNPSDTTTPLIAIGIVPIEALEEIVNCTSDITPDPMVFVLYARIRNRNTPAFKLHWTLFPAAVAAAPVEHET